MLGMDCLLRFAASILESKGGESHGREGGVSDIHSSYMSVLFSSIYVKGSNLRTLFSVNISPKYNADL